MAATPLMQQYYEIKKQNPGCILFFRMGDFFELFEEDAFLKSPARRDTHGIHIPALRHDTVLDDTRIADQRVDTIGCHHRH